MESAKVIIQLSHDEISYLSAMPELELLHQALLHADSTFAHGVAVMLSRDLIEKCRETLTDRLGKVGFDENYEVTSEGKMIENLIDRFYVA
jgi:hypothetical protein